MKKIVAIQKRYNPARTKVIESNVIADGRTEAEVVNFLHMRGYRFDRVAKAYVKGNAVQYPVTIESEDLNIFDIRSFV
jgi:hypothetical protein